MGDITIEICRSVADAKLRRKHIRSLAPDAPWKSEIVEGMDTLALYKAANGVANVTFIAEAFAGSVGVAKAAVLIIWTDDADA